jgi:uncharacterized protein (TIGR03663 family)
VAQTVLDKPLGDLIKLDWEKTLYILIIILAIATRLWGLGDRVQSHDESLHTKFSWDLYTGRGFSHTPLMHGPFLFHITALSYFLFDDNDFSARLPVALMGILVVAFPWLLRRWLGRTGALLASFFLLISPSITYYSRYIRHDIPIILWSLIVIWAIFSYLHDGRERWLYLMAAGVSLMFATKEVAFIYNAIFGLFLVALLAIQAFRRDQSSEQFKWRELRDYRVFDLVIVLGTLCLPFLLSPVLVQIAGMDPMDHNPPTLYYSMGIAGIVVLISAGIGLFWNWQRWGIAAAIHYTIFAILFTTVFTNRTGISSGMIGSLGYWLAQQEVERGGQPWYYYFLMVPLYEYLPLLLTLVTPIYLGVRGLLSLLRPATSKTELSSSNSKAIFQISSRSSLFISFLLWWILIAWVGYSYAGEKMPWLTVHLALPMILLSAWLVGRFIEGIDWPRVLQRQVWLLALIAPPFAAASIMLIKAALAGPFQGYELGQLDITGKFLGGLAGTLAFGTGLGYLIYRSGWRIAVRVLLMVMLLLPVLLTIRTTWRFCYINYDYPTEYLVYAHASQAVKETMQQVDELSRRTAGGSKLIQVAYGADGSWPFHWYLRDYPNAIFYGSTPSRENMEAPVVIAGRDEWDEVAPYMGNDYVVNTYTFLWWPMEDYRDLTCARVTRAITDTQTRAALWDIWYDRDYSSYDELTGKQHTLDAWPLRSDYRVYIRRDLAAQVWDIGGTTEPAKEVEGSPVDPYAEGWQTRSAKLVFGSQGAEPGQFERPNGIAIDPSGRFVYVADTGNHRIQKFTTDGQFIAAWGQNSVMETEMGIIAGFNEPWDVTVTSDGTIFVADTWNHRIQKLDTDGNPITAWGAFGQYGLADGRVGQGAFYGPRGIAAGADGRIYVADTGNKRLQVFDPDGQFVFQWGGGGILEGYLDEPVGIASSLNGAIYVADTWNRRVQVFDAEGTYLREWPIAGWDIGRLTDEKPYLAVGANGYVYVTDPGHYRVLVFDTLGNYVLSFGQYGIDEKSFAFPTGIDVADDGAIYVVDSHGARVLVFDPLD